MKEYYLEKIKEIKKKYIKQTPKRNDEYCLDNEMLHVEVDDLIVNLLENLVSHDIALEYLKVKQYFWYS